MRLYLDVCCLCRPFDARNHPRINMEMEAVIAILNRCRGDWTLISSDIISYEVLQIPDQKRLQCVMDIVIYASEIIEWDDSLEDRAGEIMDHGIDAMDALHVACVERADAILVTTDNSLIKKIKRSQPLCISVQVCNPVDLMLEVNNDEDEDSP